MQTLPNRAERRHDEARAGGDGATHDLDRMPATMQRARAAHGREDDLQRLLGDLATLVAGLTVATREFGRVSSRLRGATAGLGDAVGDAWEVAREHGGGALRVAERALAARPYVALGLAAGLVVALGLAVRHGLHDEAHDERDGWDHFV